MSTAAWNLNTAELALTVKNRAVIEAGEEITALPQPETLEYIYRCIFYIYMYIYTYIYIYI